MAFPLRNKKATFNHEVLETYSAGIELRGFEVKALRTGRGGSLEGAHVIERGGELFLIGAHIPEYQSGNTPEHYDSRRERKLLVTKKELKELGDTLKSRGLTIVPLSLYNKGRHIKVDIGLVRGKKKFDKRESIKKRDVERDIAREHKLR
jgi:SsrA-binding protein